MTVEERSWAIEYNLIIKKIRTDALEQAVAFIFDILEVKRRVADRSTVFIKPNIFCREPSETGATTDLQLLGVVIDYFTALGKPVSVGEAGANQFAGTGMFVDLGLEPFCNRHGARFIDLNQSPAEPIELKINNKGYKFMVPLPILDSPFLVNLPKLKTHLSTRVSWAIKNLYGLLPDKEKWLGHRIGINETLFALSKRFPVDVVLTDAIIAMKGLGPTMGLPDRKNLLIGALDQFIHDLGLLRLLEIMHVPHIEKCATERPMKIEYLFLGEDDRPVEVETLGIDLTPPPMIFSRIFIRTNQAFFTLAPYIDRLFNPKIILKVLSHEYLIRVVRYVQRSLKI